MAEGDEGRDYGKICVFCSRLCGVFSAMIFLLCGFGALIPSPSIAPGASYGRCLATGLLMILAALIVFFLEATFLGHIVDKLAFLLIVNKYMKNWLRAGLYILFAFIPIFLWCLAISTIVGMGVMFMTGAINFVLVIGAKADHSEVTQASNNYQNVKMSEVSKVEDGGEDGGESSS